MNDYWQLGRWGRIPVSMHWTVLLGFPWLYLWLNDALAALIGFAAYCVLLIAHEFGHVALCRLRRVDVHSITFNGYHGETAHGFVRRPSDGILIAWGGVGAQAIILAAAFAAEQWLPRLVSPALFYLMAPVLMVFTRWNIFLMIIALLPLGPMDGSTAWQVIPLIRRSLKRQRSSGKVVRLDPAKRRQLEKRSEKLASEIIDNLGKKK
jgi:Zn-dependent protease